MTIKIHFFSFVSFNTEINFNFVTCIKYDDMNKKFLFFLFSFFVFGNLSAIERTDTGDNKQVVADTLLPYQKSPTLPVFNILLVDSVTVLNTYNIEKGKPTALMFFDPDCKHCKATTKQLIEKIDSIKNIQFYLLSARHDMSMIRNFYEHYHLADYPNILGVGMDTEFFFFSFYKVKFVPDIALYDENKKLIKLFEGSVEVKDLYELTHK